MAMDILAPFHHVTMYAFHPSIHRRSSFSPPSLDLSHRRRFYELDDSVEVWSDYLRPHLHPKTVSILPQYTHNDENDALELYGLGAGIFNAHPT